MSDPNSDTASTVPVRNIKPLCLTRWLNRLPDVSATFSHIL